ncbi:hypothetical protein K7X08_028885 [Anisodus acutangulus]|uniref:Uncharacterized protein n=1 Tax=Anisodus acutangulus TaxID=402998 RepID=A0A9Q1L1X8_9SOLA|nr:hypothetical protein K7X08_028885 [Anisodus acutangulus]
MKEATDGINKEAVAGVDVVKGISNSNKVIVEMANDIAKDVAANVTKDADDDSDVAKDADVEINVARYITDPYKEVLRRDMQIRFRRHVIMITSMVIVTSNAEEIRILNEDQNIADMESAEVDILEPQIIYAEEVIEIHPHMQLIVFVDMKSIGSYPPSKEKTAYIYDNSRYRKEDLHTTDNSVVHVNIEKYITIQRKQIPLQQLHNVVSHNIDFSTNVDKRTKDDSGNSKIKDNAEDENVHQVFQ